MSRPAHIAALDAAAREALTRIETTEARQREVFDQNIAAYTAADRAMRDAFDAKRRAISDLRDCQKAIEKLGYCQVVKVPDIEPWNLQADICAARERAGIEGKP